MTNIRYRIADDMDIKIYPEFQSEYVPNKFEKVVSIKVHIYHRYYGTFVVYISLPKTRFIVREYKKMINGNRNEPSMELIELTKNAVKQIKHELITYSKKYRWENREEEFRIMDAREDERRIREKAAEQNVQDR